MAEFDAQKRRYRFDAQRQRHAFDARKRRLAFDAQAPSEVQEDTEPTGPTVLEDFERTDPVAAYVGDTAEFAAETTTVFNGSKALVSDPASGGTFSISDTGISTSQGHIYRCRLRLSSGTEAFGVFIFAQSETREPNGYLINFNSGRVSLFKNNNGYTKLAEDTNFSRSTDHWYEVESKVTTLGEWTVTVYNESGTQVAQIATTDTTFESGGVGWRNDGTGAKFYDYLTEEAI